MQTTRLAELEVSCILTNPHELNDLSLSPSNIPSSNSLQAHLRSSFSSVSENANAGYEDGDPYLHAPSCY